MINSERDSDMNEYGKDEEKHKKKMLTQKNLKYF